MHTPHCIRKKILQVKFTGHDRTSKSQQQRDKKFFLDYLPEVIHCGQSFEISFLHFWYRCFQEELWHNPCVIVHTGTHCPISHCKRFGKEWEVTCWRKEKRKKEKEKKRKKNTLLVLFWIHQVVLNRFCTARFKLQNRTKSTPRSICLSTVIKIQKAMKNRLINQFKILSSPSHTSLYY